MYVCKYYLRLDSNVCFSLRITHRSFGRKATLPTSKKTNTISQSPVRLPHCFFFFLSFFLKNKNACAQSLRTLSTTTSSILRATTTTTATHLTRHAAMRDAKFKVQESDHVRARIFSALCRKNTLLKCLRIVLSGAYVDPKAEKARRRAAKKAKKAARVEKSVRPKKCKTKKSFV